MGISAALRGFFSLVWRNTAKQRVWTVSEQSTVHAPFWYSAWTSTQAQTIQEGCVSCFSHLFFLGKGIVNLKSLLQFPMYKSNSSDKPECEVAYSVSRHLSGAHPQFSIRALQHVEPHALVPLPASPLCSLCWCASSNITAGMKAMAAGRVLIQCMPLPGKHVLVMSGICFQGNFLSPLWGVPTDTFTQATLLKTYWKLKPDLAIEVSCGELIPSFANFYF